MMENITGRILSMQHDIYIVSDCIYEKNMTDLISNLRHAYELNCSLKINFELITNQILAKCGNYAVNLWINYSWRFTISYVKQAREGGGRKNEIRAIRQQYWKIFLMVIYKLKITTRQNLLPFKWQKRQGVCNQVKEISIKKSVTINYNPPIRHSAFS